MHKVVSRDGTTIAYAKAGQGPPLVLVGGAFRDHTIFDPIVSLVAPHCTTFAYDRRGRGESGDAPEWSLEREIDDLAAVVAEAGGEAVVFGGSNGAILALEAGLAGVPITRMALMEPPYLHAHPSSPRPPADFAAQLDELLRQERRGEAAEYLLRHQTGFSDEEIAAWKASPMWASNEALAHTLAYDAAVVGVDPVPVERLRGLQVPALMCISDGTSDWLRAAAELAAAALPRSSTVTLPGLWHRVHPEALAPVLVEFVTGGRP